MVNRRIWAGIISLVLLIAIISLSYYYHFGPVVTGPFSTPTSTPATTADLNWAGYAVASNFSNPQPIVTGVSGSWIVPQVELSANDTFSSVWIGIGGTFRHTLIQTGTEQDSIKGKTYYVAWYELLPSPSIVITTIDVSPGDSISASIKLVNGAQNMWSIEIDNLSTNQMFSENFQYNSSRLSAEWVVERPDVNNNLSTLANYGSAEMSNCRVTLNSENRALGSLPSIRILMYNMYGTQLVDVSRLGFDKESFTIKYLNS